ncbi:MAG TPA: hypothetical protein VF188_01140 [Longimicrobiales bacterium]
MKLCGLALAGIVVLGCGGGPGAQVATRADSSRSGEGGDVVQQERGRAQDEATSAPASFDPSWVVTADGLGPIRIGMSTEEVARALGGAVDVPDEPGGCDYILPPTWPQGVAVMMVDGSVARVDVWEGGTATAEGARIGSTEDEIQALYPGRVEVRPHKYTEGHYLIVTPPGPTGAERRIVFETDGRAVERYRAGALPAVEWVEGCS